MTIVSQAPPSAAAVGVVLCILYSHCVIIIIIITGYVSLFKPIIQSVMDHYRPTCIVLQVFTTNCVVVFMLVLTGMVVCVCYSVERILWAVIDLAASTLALKRMG